MYDHPFPYGLTRMSELDATPVNLDHAGDRNDPAEHLEDPRDAGAFQPSEADHLASAQRQIKLRHSVIGTLEPDRDGALLRDRGRRRTLVSELADHGASDRRNVGVGGQPTTNDMAVPEHGQRIGDLEDLVQAVRHKDDGRILRDNRPDRVE